MSVGKVIFDYNALGGILRDYRKRKGYTQAQVTEALHFPSKRLGELENGKKQIYVHELVDLINFYEIDIYELFYPWVGSTILVKKRRIEEEIKTLPDGLALIVNHMNQQLIELLKEYKKKNGR